MRHAAVGVHGDAHGHADGLRRATADVVACEHDSKPEGRLQDDVRCSPDGLPGARCDRHGAATVCPHDSGGPEQHRWPDRRGARATGDDNATAGGAVPGLTAAQCGAAWARELRALPCRPRRGPGRIIAALAAAIAAADATAHRGRQHPPAASGIAPGVGEVGAFVSAAAVRVFGDLHDHGLSAARCAPAVPDGETGGDQPADRALVDDLSHDRPTLELAGEHGRDDGVADLRRFRSPGDPICSAATDGAGSDGACHARRLHADSRHAVGHAAGPRRLRRSGGGEDVDASGALDLAGRGGGSGVDL
mmetsp:Transcript_108760/g.314035  ORF Transcript_108760/g.314035 Transcript_108760/m.314035 type:complete len:306 (+) Transcript_108760:494-1411(+)